MSNLEKIRVHIAPLGFEIDRIVLPAKKMKAEKVWIIQEAKPEKNVAKTYLDKITKQLTQLKIQVKIFETDRKDVFKNIKAVKEIFKEEHNNEIFVNVSSGSKIQAMACMMACMMFKECNAIPYYVEPKNYHSVKGKQQSSGLKNLIELPRYEIHKPQKELIKALEIIKQKGGEITKKEMARLAHENGLIVVGGKKENMKQARYVSLENNIIQPLSEKWKFVEVTKTGRNRWIKITKDGLNAAEFLA